MTKQQFKKQTTLLKSQKAILLMCGAIMAVFIILIAVVSSGSLSLITLPHFLILLASWYVWKAKNAPKAVTRFVVFLSIIGAASVVLLIAAYLPASWVKVK